jgi:hypothetical protein
MLPVLCLAILGLSLASSSVAADRWAVLTDTGERRASAVEFAPDGASLVVKPADGAPVSLPLRSVAALSHCAVAPSERGASSTSRRRFHVELLSGERILADTMELGGDTLVVGNVQWGRVGLPVKSVWRVVASDAQLSEVPPDFTGVRYVNGDTVPGRVVSIWGAGAMVDMAGVGKIPVDDLANVADIVLSNGDARRAGSQGAEVLLLTGELLFGTCAGGADGFIKLKTAWAGEALSIPLAMLSAAVFPEGRRLLWAEPTTSATSAPFLGFHRPAVRNRALAGGPLSVEGFRASRGLALYGGTTLGFAAPAAPGGAVLLAWAGVDDAIPPGKGAAELTVAVDGVAAQIVPLEAGGGLVPLNIQLPTNAATVSFSAGITSRGPAGSHVNLLYPCLVTKPQ